MSIRPYVRYFNSSQYIDDLGNGEVCLSVGYSGDVFIARDAAAEAKAGVEVAYTIPKEGALKWFDLFAIPADAPHVDNAYKFIDFMMRPDIAAANTNYVFYASGNKAALESHRRRGQERSGHLPDRRNLRQALPAQGAHARL